MDVCRAGFPARERPSMKITPGSLRIVRLMALMVMASLPGHASASNSPPNGPNASNPDARDAGQDSASGGTQASDNGTQSGQSAGDSAPAAGSIDTPPFSVFPLVAKPYMKVTFWYRFDTSVPPDQSHTYFLQCSRQDQPDNEGGLLGQKNLDAEWKNGGIYGFYSVPMPAIASYYGNYSFRIFGPRVVKSGEKNPVGAQEIDSIKQGKLFDEGRFTFGPYQTVLRPPSPLTPHQRMTITWTDTSVNSNAWIGLFKSGMDNQHSIVRKSFINLPGSWDVDAPADLGAYEVRAFIDEGWDTTATQPFQVTWGTIQPVLSGFPATCYPAAAMPVDYANGPTDINAWIGIFDQTNGGTFTTWSRQQLQGKTSGEFIFTAPKDNGRYDIRMLDSSNNVLARSTAFQVVSGSAAIKLKADAEAGRIVLTWNNPLDYQMFEGYYVYRGTAAGAESPTPLTLGTIPADRSAAAATAVNTHIDTDVQPGTKYYYVVKPLQVDLKTLGVASTEVSAMVAAPAGSNGGSGGQSSAAAATTPAMGLGVRKMPTGAAAVPGAWSELRHAYRLGETDSFLFSLERAEYEAGRLEFGDDLASPKLGEKFLVVHFQVTNPRRQPLQLDTGRFEWTIVDAKGASITDCERFGPETDPRTFERTLEPGQSSECFAVFRVPAEGEMQSMTVRNRLDAAPGTARFDLRGKVRALPAHFADAQDRSGATAAAVVSARIGESFACGIFDVVVRSIEVVGADAPAPSGREVDLPVYTTVRYTLRAARTSGVFGGSAPIVTLVDSRGDSHGADAEPFEVTAPETTEVELVPGEASEFRLRFWIPRDAAPHQVFVQEPGGIPVRIDATK